MRILHVGWGFSPWRGGGLIAYAEDVMAEQVAAGHHVEYFCAGRQMPPLRKPRLRRWERGGVTIHEVVNPTVPHGGDRGSKTPELDLHEPEIERMLGEVLADVRPDVVHFQELAGLPSSVIDVVKDAGVPAVMTLHDYFALCPTLKLWDWQGQLCERALPGEDCRRCCREGPADASYHRRQTINAALVNLGRRFPRTKDLYRTRIAPPLWRALPTRPPGPADDGPPAPPAEEYDRRREVNAARLSRLDVLLANSHRTAEMYAERGVAPERLRVLHLTVRHFERLRARRMEGVPDPVRFGVLNAATSPQKGSDLLVDAVRRLRERGYESRYRLQVYGAVHHDAIGELSRSPSVELRSTYEPHRLNAILDEVDVGVIPSIWEEAYGLVGIEFLAKGIPVLGNAIGGIPDYTVPGQTGWLNETADAEGLAAAMAEIVDRPEQVVELHRSIVARRDAIVKPLARHVGELEGVYAELAGAPQPVAAPAR